MASAYCLVAIDVEGIVELDCHGRIDELTHMYLKPFPLC